MKRLINFYQPVFYKKADLLSASYMGVFWGATVVLLLFFSVYENWQLHREKLAFDKIREESNQMTRKLEELKKQFPEKIEATKVEDEIAQLERLLTAKTELLHKMVGVKEKERQGFSDLLKGLARQKIEGIWLDHIHLKGEGEQIGLSGYTVRPELVFQLLQRLKEEAAFKGREFNTFALKQPEVELPAVRFYLQTSEELSMMEETGKKPQEPTETHGPKG